MTPMASVWITSFKLEKRRIARYFSPPSLLLPILSLFAAPSFAQPVLTASFDRQKAVVGQTVSLRFLLEGSSDAEGFLPPDFSGFTVLNGPDTRMEVVVQHGRKVSTVTFVYLLRPERSGILRLGPASVKSDEGTVGSLPIFLHVSQTPASVIADDASGKSDPVAMATIREGLFMRLETAKTEVYVGEPILVTYRLYTRLNSESEVVKRPSFAGFGVVEVKRSDSSSPVEEVLDGQRFQSYVLRKVHLIPLREGLFELEPVVVRNRVSFGAPASHDEASSLSRLLDKLYPGSMSEESLQKTEVTLQSPSRTIRVRPLPPGAPADFSGAVGRFSLALELESDTIISGGKGLLRVAMEGSGNLPMIPPPRMEWPEGMAAYESELVEETDSDRKMLSGKRTWVFPFSPEGPGRFVIGSASMSAFDPSSGRYYPLIAEPVRVEVSASAGRPMDDQPTVVEPGGSLWKSSRPVLFIAALAVAAVFAALYHFIPRATSQAGKTVMTLADETIQAPLPFDVGRGLEAAERLLSEGRAADGCRALGRLLTGVAESRFGADASVGMDGFSGQLVGRGLAWSVAEEWADLLKGCEIEAYRPIADAESAGRLLERTRRLLGSV